MIRFVLAFLCINFFLFGVGCSSHIDNQQQEQVEKQQEAKPTVGEDVINVIIKKTLEDIYGTKQ